MHSFYCSDFLNNLPLFKSYEDNMKRIILVGLIGFALSGCGDNEDTINSDKYLVGKWECKLEQFSAKDNNGKLSNYTKENEVISIEEYKLEEGKLYFKQDNAKDWVYKDNVSTINKINKYLGKTDTNNDKLGSIVIITSMFISSDKHFSIKEELFFKKKDIANKNEHIYSKIKSEGYCTKME